jgi:hypothetical protein
MKISIKKILSLSIIIGIFVNPIIIFAETDPNTMQSSYTDSQINAAISTIRSSGSMANTADGTANTSSRSNMSSTIGTNVAGCGAGQILANIISSSVTKAIGGTVNKVIDKVINVPVSEQGSVGESIKTQTSAQVGTVVGTGGISGLTAPGWDSVAYCIVNAMIVYIADSTIQWINTGFKGNPAFVNNPDQFFKQLADEEAGAFMQELAYGTLGVNICSIFKTDIILTVANQYTGQGGYQTGYQNGGYGGGMGMNNSYGGCTFDELDGELEGFLKGDMLRQDGWESWYQVSQNPSNNPYAVYFNVKDALTTTVNKTLTTSNQELNWNNGFLNFKTCKDPKDKSTCTTVTPGTVIQDQLNTTLNLGKNRLVLATKFDQVVTALVDKLIQTAIGHTLQAIRN